jgi:hypothetical protein
MMAGVGGGDMLARRELAPILDDEALTRHLGDAEARVLVEWLVEQAESLGEIGSIEQARAELARLCRRGRVMARFVRLWCLEDLPGAASQLVAAERLDWPLPDGPIDPDRLMQQLVDWEDWKRRQAI